MQIHDLFAYNQIKRQRSMKHYILVQLLNIETSATFIMTDANLALKFMKINTWTYAAHYNVGNYNFPKNK